MLAGPAPSGSTGTSRLCRGCSRPPQRFPGQAAPSFAALLRQGQRRKVSHLHSNQQRLTAHARGYQELFARLAFPTTAAQTAARSYFYALPAPGVNARICRDERLPGEVADAARPLSSEAASTRCDGVSYGTVNLTV